MRVQFVLQEIWIGLRRNLTMTISLVITVAIAMALFGTGLLIKAQVDNSKSYWDGKIQVSHDPGLGIALDPVRVEYLAGLELRESPFYDDIKGDAPSVGQIL